MKFVYGIYFVGDLSILSDKVNSTLNEINDIMKNFNVEEKIILEGRAKLYELTVDRELIDSEKDGVIKIISQKMIEIFNTNDNFEITMELI